MGKFAVSFNVINIQLVIRPMFTSKKPLIKKVLNVRRTSIPFEKITGI